MAMVTTILKYDGIKSKQLAALHELLKSDVFDLKDLDPRSTNPRYTTNNAAKIKFVKLKSAVYNNKYNDDYVVELSILSGVSCYIKDEESERDDDYKHVILNPPALFLQKIHDCFGILAKSVGISDD